MNARTARIATVAALMLTACSRATTQPGAEPQPSSPPPLAGAAPNACAGPWVTTPGPALGSVTSLDRIAAGSAFGIGSSLLRFTAGAWTPLAEATDHWYLDVAAISQTEAFAVGFLNPTERFVITRWNGTAFVEMQSPAIAPGFHLLSGVDAASASRAWAVGAVTNAGTIRPALLGWDGRAWKAETLPGSMKAGALLDVVAVSETEAWAVGFREANGTDEPVALRYDGSAWKTVPVPRTAGAWLTAIDANRSTVWTTGAATDAIGSQRPVVLRLRQGAFEPISVPAPPGSDPEDGPFYTGVAVADPLDIWLVGGALYQRGGEATIEPISARFDGSAWTHHAVDPNLRFPVRGSKQAASPRALVDVLADKHDLATVAALSPDLLVAAGMVVNDAAGYAMARVPDNDAGPWFPIGTAGIYSFACK